MAAALEPEIRRLTRLLAQPGERRRSAVLRSSWWSERMLEWAMSHPSFRTDLFRFVDVLPATGGGADVMRHLTEYFEGGDVPRSLDLALDLAAHVPLGAAAAAAIARRNVAAIAHQFIAGSDPEEAAAVLRDRWGRRSAFTVDLLGERTVTEAEADRYAERVVELISVLGARTARWPADERLEHDDLGPVARLNISVKPSALASLYAPLTGAEGLARARRRLLPVLREAVRLGAFVNLDMEHVEVRELTLELFTGLLAEPELAELDAGIAVQAYLRDARADLERLIDLSSRRSRPLTIRLVKGAYWDTEMVVAGAEGWPPPVHPTKAATDAAYETLSRLLLDRHGEVRAAFGSHNARSLAHAIAYARWRGIPDNGYEIQTLHGMAEPIERAVRGLGLRHRVYAPVGRLIPGMAYLVRRLLENTADEGFVRRRFVEGRDLDELVQRPAGPPTAPGSVSAASGLDSPVPELPGWPGPYRREPPAEWRRAAVRAGFAAAVRSVGDAVARRRRSAAVPVDVPALIDGHQVRTGRSITSVDPGDVATVVASATACGAAEADAAVAAAARAGPAWRATPMGRRTAVLLGAAAWMRSRRAELAALEIFEAGKPWSEADGDVCEAIDCLEYYARQALRLDGGAAVESPPGERNTLRHQPRGVAAVIAPWNFPLAIPTGMVAAALVTGNTVVLKPAEQTPAVAARLVEALRAGGVPDGVLAFLPGRGEEVGARLVVHPEVALIAFTGSRDVGLGIAEAAAVHRPGQRQLRRVITEMGGKNAIIVDADADLDQAIPLILTSAFGHAGQKCSACSRLITIGSIHDQLLARLTGAARELIVGHPRGSAVQIGPLIDGEALDRVRSYVAIARAEGEIALAVDDVPAGGHFAGPTIVTGLPAGSRVATEEVFGPLLAVFPAADLDEALAIAGDTDYALTAGIISRSPSHIARATEELRAGNVYVNRTITGAVVGRQPFGGFGLSGTGVKAGGPEYLLQFVDARAVSENTVRQGFAPLGGRG